MSIELPKGLPAKRILLAEAAAAVVIMLPILPYFFRRFSTPGISAFFVIHGLVVVALMAGWVALDGKWARRGLLITVFASMAATTSSSRSARRPETATWAPCSANSRANARPSPLPPPVIQTILS